VIKAGDAEIIVAGGMENMSNVPYALPNARWGYRMNMPFGQATDLMVHDGLWEIFYNYHMGNTAENIAAKYGISREEQDKLAYESHRRARAATPAAPSTDEIVPVVIPQKKGEPKIFNVDERPMDTTLEKMAKLPPVFRKDGTVTAGNASGINDAAAAVVVMSEKKAKELNLKPLPGSRDTPPAVSEPSVYGSGAHPRRKEDYSKSSASR